MRTVNINGHCTERWKARLEVGANLAACIAVVLALAQTFFSCRQWWITELDNARRPRAGAGLVVQYSPAVHAPAQPANLTAAQRGAGHGGDQFRTSDPFKLPEGHLLYDPFQLAQPAPLGPNPPATGGIDFGNL